MAFNPSGIFSSQGMGGLGGFLGGMFGNTDAPYDNAMDQYRNYGNKALGAQNPFYNAGMGGMNNYQEWLGGMKDPSAFINNMMQNYQQSPYNQYLQQQSQNAGQNAASASGLMGSTPFLQQSQQNAANIGQQGMDSWLKNVLGINSEYGQGQNNLMGVGQNAANNMSNIYNNMGQQMGDAEYNKGASGYNNFMNTIGGGLGAVGSMFL